MFPIGTPSNRCGSIAPVHYSRIGILDLWHYPSAAKTATRRSRGVEHIQRWRPEESEIEIADVASAACNRIISAFEGI